MVSCNQSGLSPPSRVRYLRAKEACIGNRLHPIPEHDDRETPLHRVGVSAIKPQRQISAMALLSAESQSAKFAVRLHGGSSPPSNPMPGEREAPAECRSIMAPQTTSACRAARQGSLQDSISTTAVFAFTEAVGGDGLDGTCRGSGGSGECIGKSIDCNFQLDDMIFNRLFLHAFEDLCESSASDVQSPEQYNSEDNINSSEDDQPLWQHEKRLQPQPPPQSALAMPPPRHRRVVAKAGVVPRVMPTLDQLLSARVPGNAQVRTPRALPQLRPLLPAARARASKLVPLHLKY